MQPALVDPIVCLYGMLDDADQAPVREAMGRFHVLAAETEGALSVAD